MSDDPIKYVFTSPWDGGVGYGRLQEIAGRFNVETDEILRLSAGEPWAQGIVARGLAAVGAGLKDKDIVWIPRRAAEWPLDHGASWTEWAINDGDTLQTIVDDLKGGSPIGLLVPAWGPKSATDLPHSSVSAMPRVSLASFIWYYYANAALRADTLRASGKGVEADQLATFPDLTLSTKTSKSIWVPIVPPVRSVIAVAPSSVQQPLTGATVEVKPNEKLHALTNALRNIELQLNGIHINRANIADVLNDGDKILASLRQLRETMTATAKGWEGATDSAAAYYPNVASDPDSPGAKERRAVAMAKLERLIAVAEPKIQSHLRKEKPGEKASPIWSSFTKTAVATLDIASATSAVRTLVAADGLMPLVAELCPLMFDAPVRNLAGAKVALLDYVCGIGAAAAAALANSTKTEEVAFVQGIARSHTAQNTPGPGCKSLIEYAWACANGFVVGDHVEFPPTTAPYEALGVQIAIEGYQTLNELSPTVKTSGDRVTASDVAKKAAEAAFNKAIDKIRPLLEKLGILKEKEPATGIVAKLKDAAAFCVGEKGNFDKVTQTLKLGEYEAEELRAFAGGFLAPFAKEKQSPFAKFIPKGMGGSLAILGTLWEIATAESEIVEAASSAKLPWSGAAKAGADTAKAGADITKATLEGAKALKLFATSPEGEAIAFGAPVEGIIAIFGRASFLLGAVCECVEVWQAAEEKNRRDEAGHIMGAVGYTCLFIATAGGMPVLVVIGAGLLVGDIVLTKGSAIKELLEGKAVADYDAIIGAPAGVDPYEDAPPEKGEPPKKPRCADYVAAWAGPAGFDQEVADFKSAFHREDFGPPPLQARTTDLKS